MGVRFVSRLDRFLESDEQVVGDGKPQRAPFVLPVLGFVPFGLFFLAFVVFFFLNAASAGAPDFFLFPLTIFILISVAIIFVPIAWQLLRYRNTQYLITNKRIITQTGAIGRDTRFVDFDKIQEVYVTVGVVDRLFGTGSLYAMTAGTGGFGPMQGPYGYGRAYGYQRPSLAALKEPYQVQKMLQEAVERRKTSVKNQTANL